MDHAPLMSANEHQMLSPLRLLYVSGGGERADGLASVPIDDWIETAKRSQSGFDDLTFWHHELQALGVGPDAALLQKSTDFAMRQLSTLFW